MSDPDVIGPIVLWENLGSEGWHPTSYPTIDDALRDRHYNDFIITRSVNWKAVEIDEPGAIDTLPRAS